MGPTLFLTLLIVLALVVAAMFVAGVGPFAARKGREPGVEEEEEASRPLHDTPHPEQFATEKGRIFPPAH